MHTRLVFALCFALSVPASALADVVDREMSARDCPPVDCLPGSGPVAMSHGCPHLCAPGPECQTDADCAQRVAGATCEPTRFCLGSVQEGPGQSLVVYDTCLDNGPCGEGPAPEGQEAPSCVEQSRCVYPAQAAAPARAQGGCAGCATSKARPSVLHIGLGLLILGLLRRATRG